MNITNHALFEDAVRIAYIRRVLWDVDVNPENLLRVIDGASTESGSLDRTAIYAKLLGSYSWYTLLRIIPSDHLTEALSEDVLRRVWPISLRKRYENARELLSGSALSSAGNQSRFVELR
jgi:hypothetical protein